LIGDLRARRTAHLQTQAVGRVIREHTVRNHVLKHAFVDFAARHQRVSRGGITRLVVPGLHCGAEAAERQGAQYQTINHRFSTHHECPRRNG
jgi:hypothetical protein